MLPSVAAVLARRYGGRPRKVTTRRSQSGPSRCAQPVHDCFSPTGPCVRVLRSVLPGTPTASGRANPVSTFCPDRSSKLARMMDPSLTSGGNWAPGGIVNWVPSSSVSIPLDGSRAVIFPWTCCAPSRHRRGPLRRALRLHLDGPTDRHGRDDGGHEQDNWKRLTRLHRTHLHRYCRHPSWRLRSAVPMRNGSRTPTGSSGHPSRVRRTPAARPSRAHWTGPGPLAVARWSPAGVPPPSPRSPWRCSCRRGPRRRP